MNFWIRPDIYCMCCIYNMCSRPICNQRHELYRCTVQAKLGLLVCNISCVLSTCTIKEYNKIQCFHRSLNDSVRHVHVYFISSQICCYTFVIWLGRPCSMKRLRARSGARLKFLNVVQLQPVIPKTEIRNRDNTQAMDLQAIVVVSISNSWQRSNSTFWIALNLKTR